MAQRPISIPEPTNDVDSLWASVKALKEAVETIQGIRGDRAYVTESAYDSTLANIEDRLTFQETKAYAGMYVKDNTNTVALNSSAKIQVTNFNTNGEFEGATPDHTNDHITINVSGTYFVIITMAVANSAGAAHVINVDLFKNNGATVFNTVHAHRSLAAGSDVGSIGISGEVTVFSGDTLELWADTDSGSDRNVIFEDIAFSIIQIR